MICSFSSFQVSTRRNYRSSRRYVQCDIEVPEHLRDYFSNFPSIFKNTFVSRDGIGSLMKQYAEKENIMPQPRRMLISSFILTNGTIITPLFCST